MSLEALQQKQFIIIDDDETTLFYSSVVLKKFFYYSEVISFKSPSKAVEYFYGTFTANPRETVVLLDINMPGLSGWDVLDKLKMLPQEIKQKLSIIIVSSFTLAQEKLTADDSELVIGYIEKPFSIKKLKDLMDLREIPVKTVITQLGLAV